MSNRLKFLLFLLFVVTLGSSYIFFLNPRFNFEISEPQAATLTSHKGVYALWDSQDSLYKENGQPKPIAENKGIVGVVLSIKWKDIETSEGNLNWSEVRKRITEASQLGFKVALTPVLSQVQTPQWAKVGSKKITLCVKPDETGECTSYTAPVYWDAQYISRKISFIEKMGEQFTQNPNVIAVNAPFVNFVTGDWYIPVEDGQYAIWNDAASPATFTSLALATGKQIIDATAAAFPNQTIKLSIQRTNEKLTGTNGNIVGLANDIMDYAYSSSYGSRFYAQMNFLHSNFPIASDPAATNPFLTALHQRPRIGLQTLAAAYLCATATDCRQSQNTDPRVVPGHNLNLNGLTLSQAVLQQSFNIALSYGVHYYELWQGDGNREVDSGFYPIISNATRAMGGTPRGEEPSPTPVQKVGDINNDGKVDILDYDILITAFESTTDLRADLNGNGRIDIYDYNIVIANFGK